MRLLGLMCVLAVSASQVSALSCMSPDPVRTFQNAAAASETYYVLYGTFDFDAKLLPKDTIGIDTPVQPAPISAIFRGNGLSKTGFDLRFDQLVTIQPVCAGPWCGSTSPNVPALAFVRVDGDQLVVEAGPCGGQIFAKPTQAQLDSVSQCINGNCPSVLPLH